MSSTDTHGGSAATATLASRPTVGRDAPLARPVTPSVTKGVASLVFFHYGDSKYASLVQERLELKHAIEGYKYSVLLKHENVPPFWDLSGTVEKRADVKAAPTQANLLDHIIGLARDGYMIDLYILSHGWSGGFRVSNGWYGDNGHVTTDEILAGLSPSRTGLTRMPIRMVYGVNSYFRSMATAWRKVGARTTAGARYAQFYPNQFPRFLHEWNKGDVGLEDAVRISNTPESRTAVQTYIATVHALSTRHEWGSCPLRLFVLSGHRCARDYFTHHWLFPGEWRDGLNGRENMNYSSQMLVDGDRDLTKNWTPR